MAAKLAAILFYSKNTFLVIVNRLLHMHAKFYQTRFVDSRVIANKKLHKMQKSH